MKIYEFELGATIVRVDRSSSGDGSYIGEMMRFCGIYNGMIHLETLRPRPSDFKDVKVPFESYKDGWEFWNRGDCNPCCRECKRCCKCKP